MEQTTLYFRQGSSDKIYQASIEPKGGNYVVQFAFGRRGTTLQTGTKTQDAVPYDQAKRVFDKLIREKMARGYTPGENGTPYKHTAKEKTSAGINCQLLNAIGEDEVKRFIDDPKFCMQEKLDGRRLLIRKQNDEVTGINRLGLFVGVAEPVAAAAGEMPGDFVIDGEGIGEILHAFDLLAINGADIRRQPYRDRYRQLHDLIKRSEKCIPIVPTSFTQSQKALAFCTFKAMKAEGVVFKQLDAPYTFGRPASGGSQLKFKFCETASLVVGKVNGKRSVSLILFDGKREVPVGNVTIPANKEIPRAGQVVEVRYLYAFPGGSIFQPVYLGVRSDIDSAECVIRQLKFKPDVEKEAA